MKLTYWHAPHLTDGKVYSIRERTKAAAVARKAQQPDHFGEIAKVVIDYADGFDLLQQCTGECGIIGEKYI